MRARRRPGGLTVGRYPQAERINRCLELFEAQFFHARHLGAEHQLHAPKRRVEKTTEIDRGKGCPALQGHIAPTRAASNDSVAPRRQMRRWRCYPPAAASSPPPAKDPPPPARAVSIRKILDGNIFVAEAHAQRSHLEFGSKRKRVERWQATGNRTAETTESSNAPVSEEIALGTSRA